jgi:hypothetical protein
MMFNEFDPESQFRTAWESVNIARPVHYSLFTFGETVLPYYLVCADSTPGATVSVTKGEVRIKRPMIITPDSDRPEFEGFFENSEEEGFAEFLLARTARFSNLKFDNTQGEKQIVSDSLEEAVANLNRRLDDEEDDRIAVLTAPQEYAGVAVLRYAAERVMESGPDNIQELRERGFLP